ncbi:MAG TPA: ion channel [Candidatus Kapabacteria bacterium]|nr:ion channel [Candidatus Kapabacteria bacterium]
MIYRSKNRELLKRQMRPVPAPANEAPELGFGTRASIRGQRLVLQDGTFNVKRVGERSNIVGNAFHHLITMSWSKFFGMLVIAFIIANIIFAGVYYLLGVQHLQGMIGTTFFDEITESFFFSTQTLTTLGYGRISPVGFWTSFVAAIESMLGLLSFAMATGLLYGRFSHPDANIIYSKAAIIAPYRGGRGLMFRIANGRRNQLIELEALVTLARDEGQNGEVKRKFYFLDLELKKISVLSSSWTIVHPIIEGSPFFGMTASDIASTESEVLVQIKAFDETYSQNVYSRSSYTDREIVFGAKFISAFSTEEDGTQVIDLRKIDDYEEAVLPLQKLTG